MRLMLTMTAAMLLATTPAFGDIAVRFTESAPKDRFRITNLSTCPTGPLEVVIDLTGSSAGLIFDTTGRGAGVSVFQPFELIAGAEQVEAVSDITDGDSLAVLGLSNLPGKAHVAFTIDVDDTLAASTNGQTMISGSEISGARVSLRVGSAAPVEARFDADGTATVPWQACLS